jgi:transcriptional regulator with XRE-family HTH domain
MSASKSNIAVCVTVVTANTYYRYERDESKPSPYMLARLTEVLKVRAGELEDSDQDTFDSPSADRIANNAMGFAETNAQTFDHSSPGQIDAADERSLSAWRLANALTAKLKKEHIEDGEYGGAAAILYLELIKSPTPLARHSATFLSDPILVELLSHYLTNYHSRLENELKQPNDHAAQN